jgi:hypothetical protein
MTPERIVAVFSGLLAIVSVIIAWWSARSSQRSARVAEESLGAIRESVAEAERLRQDQMGYAGGDYCINYRDHVLALYRYGWKADQIRELLYKEDGFANAEKDCGSIADILRIASQADVAGQRPAMSVAPTQSAHSSDAGVGD